MVIILDATLVVCGDAALKASVVVTLFASRLFIRDEGVDDCVAIRWLCT